MTESDSTFVMVEGKAVRWGRGGDDWSVLNEKDPPRLTAEKFRSLGT